METLINILGFIFGVAIFLVMMRYLDFLFVNFLTIIFIFGISLALGVIIAKVFWWIAIIGIVICIIVWLLSPKKTDETEKTEPEIVDIDDGNTESTENTESIEENED